MMDSPQRRSEKYLFRVRKDSPVAAGAQIRNRKGGYLFRYTIGIYLQKKNRSQYFKTFLARKELLFSDSYINIYWFLGML